MKPKAGKKWPRMAEIYRRFAADYQGADSPKSAPWSLEDRETARCNMSHSTGGLES